MWSGSLALPVAVHALVPIHRRAHRAIPQLTTRRRCKLIHIWRLLCTLTHSRIFIILSKYYFCFNCTVKKNCLKITLQVLEVFMHKESLKIHHIYVGNLNWGYLNISKFKFIVRHQFFRFLYVELIHFM